MKTFYFVGGPKTGMREQFFQRLNEIGGAPQGWVIYPHVSDDKALHLAPAESIQAVIDHLAHFDGIYEHGEIIEVHPARR